MSDEVERFAKRTAPYLKSRAAKEEWHQEALETAAYFTLLRNSRQFTRQESEAYAKVLWELFD